MVLGTMRSVTICLGRKLQHNKERLIPFVAHKAEFGIRIQILTTIQIFNYFASNYGSQDNAFC